MNPVNSMNPMNSVHPSGGRRAGVERARACAEREVLMESVRALEQESERALRAIE